MTADTGDEFAIKRALYPAFPHNEATRGTFNTCTPENVYNFLGQCMVWIFNETMTSPLSTEMHEMVLYLAAESNLMISRFNTVCGQVLSYRNNNVKDVFFDSLGYSSIRVANVSDGNDEIDLLKNASK